MAHGCSITTPGWTGGVAFALHPGDDRGLAVGFLGIEVWPPMLMSIEMVGDISIPLMLFALGVRLADSRISAVGFGLFRCGAAPAGGHGAGLGPASNARAAAA